MNKILAGLILIILIAGGAYAAVTYSNREPAVDQQNQSVSNANDAAIRSSLEAFGQKLKNVSLLAPDAGAQIEAQYAGFVAPELIAQWKANPEQALGRETSSPWPDRIEVVSTSEAGSQFRADANILEVTSSGPAAVQPVTFMMENRNGQWLVVSVQKGAYSTLPAPSTTVGTWECLPHKNQTGPQTDECAFGIAVDQSDGHYAIDTSLMSTYPVDFPTGTKVKVVGIVVPSEQLSATQKYDIDGIIRATSITKI